MPKQPIRYDDRDFFQALRWNKAYRRAYSLYEKTSIWDDWQNKKNKILNQKYKLLKKMQAVGLEHPIDPDKILDVLKGLQNSKPRHRGDRARVTDFSPAVRLRLVPDNTGNKWSVLREKRYLCVEIDIRADRDSIQSEAWAFVTECRKHVKYKHEALPKPYSPELWDVYAAVQKGEKLAEIARRNTGETGNAAYNVKLKLEDRRLRDLYKKAKNIVQTVYPPRHHG